MSDFNLPDDCTGEMVDAAHGEPDRDRVCGNCRHCIEECCDYGVCDRKLRTSPKAFFDWDEVLDYIEDFRVDMQEDLCGGWEGYR